MKKPWTPEEVAALRRMYPDTVTSVIAKSVGRSAAAVYGKAESLGLKKSQAFLESSKSGRIKRGRTDPRMFKTQFVTGQRAWNAGISFNAGGRSAETRFKPGRRAEESHNYVPLGSHRVTKDGYLERKVSDDKSLAPARRWAFVHRLVWEAAHGPIPRDCVVTFRRGMKTARLEEITVDRLECISRGELAKRNHPISRSPELARLVQIKGAITRQVNRIVRESKEAQTK